MRRDLFSCETFYARDCPHYILYTRDILYTRARAKKLIESENRKTMALMLFHGRSIKAIDKITDLCYDNTLACRFLRDARGEAAGNVGIFAFFPRK